MAKNDFPKTYGHPTRALPDVVGPLNIDHSGDDAPDNDMAEVGPEWAKGQRSRDPIGIVVDSK